MPDSPEGTVVPKASALGLRPRSGTPIRPPDELDDLCERLAGAEGDGIFATTVEHSPFLTLDLLVEQIEQTPLPSDAIGGGARHLFDRHGICPLVFAPGKDGLRLVLALRSHNPSPTKEGSTAPVLRSKDEVLVNLNDAVLPCLHENVLATPESRELGRVYILMMPDDFQTVTKCAFSTEDRRKFLNRYDDETSAVEIFTALVGTAIKNGASDIHIEPLDDRSGRIRYRVDGVLGAGERTLSARALLALTNVIKNSARMKLEERRRPQDGGITFDRGAGKAAQALAGYNLRVSTMPTNRGEKTVLRILKVEQAFDLRDLGYSDAIYRQIQTQIEAPYGLILVTGPTGCGKTTTLYSILQEKNTEDVNIVTIEDPVEITIPGVNQSQVNRAIDWDFETSLRTYLRQDPDIILVGEIRDTQTARTAMEAAKTGHQVFSTLHTNDAVSSLFRLHELGVDASDLQSSLQAVIAQRLVRVLCVECRRPYDYGNDLRALLKSDAPHGPVPGYAPETDPDALCLACGGLRHRGRTPIAEIWVPGEDEKQLIFDGCRDYQRFLRSAVQGGMRPLVLVGIDLVLAGRTTLAELAREIPKDHFVKRRDMIVAAVERHGRS